MLLFLTSECAWSPKTPAVKWDNRVHSPNGFLGPPSSFSFELISMLKVTYNLLPHGSLVQCLYSHCLWNKVQCSLCGIKGAAHMWLGLPPQPHFCRLSCDILWSSGTTFLCWPKRAKLLHAVAGVLSPLLFLFLWNFYSSFSFLHSTKFSISSSRRSLVPVNQCTWPYHLLMMLIVLWFMTCFM